MTLTKVVGGVIADGTIASADITDSTITNAKMALSPANASNLSSGDVPLAQLGNVPDPDFTAQKADIALLAFKTQANGNLARYNLVDQSVDAFEDATGVDASASTGELRNSTGKYYSGGSVVTPTVTGGTVTTVGDYTFHHFTASGNFITDTAQDMEVLLVAGGGGGGRHSGGGGGGGGLVHQTTRSISAATHAYVQGAGGPGQWSGPYPGDPGGAGSSGQDSTFNSLTAKGGGGGGSGGVSVAGLAGGSGGGTGRTMGAGGATIQGTQPGDSGTYGFGFIGGAGAAGSGAPNYTAAGGGGAGAVGVDSSASASGAGGAGKLLSSFTAFGVSGYFAGGGGGNSQGGGNYGAGGSGGGARGGNSTGGNDGFGRNGTANTGGGGGGSQYDGTTGANAANGGSGTLVIKRLTDITTISNMTLVSVAVTAETAPTKADLVFTYTDGAGTAVMGTNITAEYSADAGVTWTDFGIAAGDVQGTTGGHTIVTKNNVTLTSTSGTNMRYRIKTLVQSASLATRIHAVSLGWS
jgi:hypothetical protein